MANRSLISSATIAAAALAFLSAAFPISRALVAQAPSTVEEPQYVAQFFMLGPDAKLVALEQQKTTHESKTHNRFISVSVDSAQVVQGATSPVRVPPTAHFIVRTTPGSETIDPNTRMALKPFVVQKSERTIPMSSAKGGVFQSVKGGQAADSSIPVTFKKYGQTSLEIIPSQPLPAGEYLLTTTGGYGGVFCFGVDAK